MKTRILSVISILVVAVLFIANSGMTAHAATIEVPQSEVIACNTIPDFSSEYEERKFTVDDTHAELQGILRQETEFPIFLQTNETYSEVKYGGGNVGTSGCGISCAAMVNTYLNFKDNYNDAPTPADLATYVMREAKSGSSNLEKMKFALNSLNLTYTDANIDVALKAVREGGICIFLHQPLTAGVSLFTSGGHFFVVYGYNEANDTYMVADPNGNNYQHMFEHFQTGFTRYELLRGYGGALIIEAE